MSAIYETQFEQPQNAGADLPQLLFLARSLQQGGAERQLVALASGLHQRGWPVTVVCFYGGGTFQPDLERAGVPLVDLKKRGRWDVFGFLWRLWRVLRKTNADIVHGYLPVANMMALLARIAHPHTKVIWGVRSSYIDREKRDWLSRLSFRLSCRLARFADSIIANSEAGAAYHAALGYPAARIRVIHNGIDTQRFRFDAGGRKRMREAWGISDACVLVGLVGRIDPMKDHPTFLRAAALLAKRESRWRFVCIGGGKPGFLQTIKAQAQDLGLKDHVIWAGAQHDMAAVYSALDIAVSASCGEGFSNVIAEAMACGRNCVVTNVGDSARIVGTCGAVVEARNPEALATAIERLRNSMENHDESARLRTIARKRIEDAYSLESLVRKSEEAFLALNAKFSRT